MTGINQSFILTGTKGITARLTVLESYDALSNTSDLQIGVEVASALYGGHIYYLSGFVAAQGETLQAMSAYAGSHFVYLERTGTYYPVAAGDTKHTGSPWSVTGIRHETDGSKTVAIDVHLVGEEANGSGADGWEVIETIEVPLTHIPRASTIAATDALVGAVSMVVVSRKSADYTHTIRYRFGNLSGYLTESGTSGQERKLQQTNVAFFIPESFYAQIPTARSGSCTLECKTYAGETPIGEIQSCTFTVGTDPGACAPEVTGTVKDGNPNTAALTGDENVLVRYASNAVCTITATPRKNATIVEKRVDSLPVTGNSRTIVAVEKDSVLFSARDSRGYTTDVAVKKTMIPYVHLTCHPEVRRTDPTSGNAALTVTGDCFFGSFGSVANQLALHYRIGSGAWQPMTVQPEGNKYTAQAQLTGLSYTSSYPVEVWAEDRLQTVTKKLVLGKGTPVFDWGEKDFAFHVPVYLSGLPQRGSEAVCRDYADKKLSVVTLWENPDPGAEFPAQTVQLDLSGCAFVFCAAIARTGQKDYQLSSIVPNASGNAGHINSFHCDGGDFWLNWRRFTVRYNSIQFDEAWMRDMKNNTLYEDWRGRSVPVAIYGVKGSIS